MKASDWQPIATAVMDGRQLQLRRVHKGRIVSEGIGYWGVLDAAAPQRHWEPGNALTPPSPPFDKCDEPRWCLEEGLYNFPTPTHWKPIDG